MKFRNLITVLGLLLISLFANKGSASEPPAATTMSNSMIEYVVADKPYAVLKAAEVTAVVVDNQAVDDAILSGHRGGYNGIASLTHAKHAKNMFVPDYAGLNLEHVLDGTNQDRDILFGPRKVPMQLRVINKSTTELYQKSSLHYCLESCTRYEMLDDGTIEMTFECIPRKDTYRHNYISLFWASYINQPESLDIHFKGFDNGGPKQPRWIRGITPGHGKLSTHLSTDDNRQFPHDEDYFLTLVFNFSNHRYSEPWYYGVNDGMAYVLMFRPEDQVRLTQSPSGGGSGNPAWDFQFLISDYKINQRYQYKLRAMYVPFESPEQIEKITAPHRKALGQ